MVTPTLHMPSLYPTTDSKPKTCCKEFMRARQVMLFCWSLAPTMTCMEAVWQVFVLEDDGDGHDVIHSVGG
jgi:hypothetical protein